MNVNFTSPPGFGSSQLLDHVDFILKRPKWWTHDVQKKFVKNFIKTIDNFQFCDDKKSNDFSVVLLAQEKELLKILKLNPNLKNIEVLAVFFGKCHRYFEAIYLYKVCREFAKSKKQKNLYQKRIDIIPNPYNHSVAHIIKQNIEGQKTLSRVVLPPSVAGLSPKAIKSWYIDLLCSLPMSDRVKKIVAIDVEKITND